MDLSPVLADVERGQDGDCIEPQHDEELADAYLMW